jgi:L-rhamnose mutarotase
MIPYLMMHLLAAIERKLRKHSMVRQIINPIVTEEEFKSVFKCVLEKTSSSFSGRGVHHYKDFEKCSEDGLAGIQSAIHVAMMKVSLATGFCPEWWKNAIDVMLEKIPGIVRSNKL